MANKITSREYKMILSSDRFDDREKGISEFMDIVRLLADQLGARVEERDSVEVRRTSYLDTPAFHLDQAGFALRIRFEEDDGRYKIALKHRTPDRYLAASKDVTSPRHAKNGAKFEEDILPKFRSLFSQSNAIWFDDLPKLDTFGRLAKLFPGLKDLEIDTKERLVTVNGFEAHEVFHKLCKLKFETKPNVKLGLSFWYHTPDSEWPLIAECAFDYETEKGDDFPVPVIEGTNRFFSLLQNQPGWFNLNATTKTRYVFDGLS